MYENSNYFLDKIIHPECEFEIGLHFKSKKLAELNFLIKRYGKILPDIKKLTLGSRFFNFCDPKM